MKSKVQSISISQPVRLTGFLVAMLLLLAACAPSPISAAAPTATLPAAATATTAPQAAVEAEINVVDNPTLGKILVGNNGLTLYMFTKDGPDKSNCNADCVAKWPPLLTLGSPKLGAGVDAAMVGTATLADGSKIVTYNKMPLYYWANDKKAGDTNGQNVGSVWFVVSPDGKAVGMQPAATPAAAAAAEAEVDMVDNPTLGKILVGANGMTLYMFTKDGPDQSNCNAACLAKWPPLLSQVSPKAGAGVDAAMLGTASLADGSKIVTYNQMPLYYFAADKAAGDTNGQNVGSVWFVVSPDGKVVGMEPAATATVAAAASSSEAELSVVSNTILGQILVGANGMTLYIFTKDGPNQSNCNAACLANWPPLITEGSPKLGAGVDDSKVGTTTLADGRKIVTYNQMPLYYYAGDKAAGDTTGQGVGSVWYVISPDGKVVGNGSGYGY